MPRPAGDPLRGLAQRLKTVDEQQLRRIAGAVEAEEAASLGALSSLDSTDFIASPDASSTVPSEQSPAIGTRAADQLVKASRLVSELQATAAARAREAEGWREKCGTLQASLDAALTRAEGLKREALALARHRDEILRQHQAREQQQQQAKAATEADLEAVAAALEQAERRAGEFRANVKRTLGEGLLVSEEAYAALSTVPEEDLDIVQFVRCRAYEEVHRWRAQAEEKARALDMLTEHADYTADALRRTQQQLEHSRAVWEEETQTMGQALERYEKKNERLMAELEDVTSRYDAAKAKELAFNKVQERADTAEKQVAKLESEVELLRQRLEYLQQERNEFRTESLSDKHGMQNAANELKFVMRENDFLLTRVKELEAEKARWDERVQELKKAKQEALDRLQQEREQLAAQHEARLLRETERLRAESQRDLDCIRAQCREVADREARALREARDTAVEEAARLKARIRDAKLEREQALSEFKALQESSCLMVAELKGTLKTREFELDRARMTAEACEANAQHLKAEHEIAVRKLEVLRTEFYETQIEHNALAAELRGQVDTLRERLSVYSALEAETDGLICTAAQTAAAGPADAEQLIQQAVQSLSIVPTAPARRVQQAIELARQATALQAQVLQLRRELDVKAEAEAQGRVELARLREVVGHAGQPIGYFVTALQEKDQEIQRLTGLLHTLRTKYDELLTEYDSVNADLERLLAQKQEVVQMKHILLQLRAGVNPSALSAEIPTALAPSPQPSAPAKAGAGDAAGAAAADGLAIVIHRPAVWPTPPPGVVELHRPTDDADLPARRSGHVVGSVPTAAADPPPLHFTDDRGTGVLVFQGY